MARVKAAVWWAVVVPADEAGWVVSLVLVRAGGVVAADAFGSEGFDPNRDDWCVVRAPCLQVGI